MLSFSILFLPILVSVGQKVSCGRKEALTLLTSSDQLTELSDGREDRESPIPVCFSRQLILDFVDGVRLRIETLTHSARIFPTNLNPVSSWLLLICIRAACHGHHKETSITNTCVAPSTR